MSDYMKRRKEADEKAAAMSEEERNEFLERKRNLSAKLHPTPYFHRNPHVTGFNSFRRFFDYMADKGWDRPGIVWIKEGDKYHDVCVDRKTEAVRQHAQDRHHEYSNEIRYSDDMLLADACLRATPRKVEMA